MKTDGNFIILQRIERMGKDMLMFLVSVISTREYFVSQIWQKSSWIEQILLWGSDILKHVLYSYSLPGRAKKGL